MLCPGCGNEVEAGSDCAVCRAAEELLEQATRAGDSRLCRDCGNEIYGDGACQVCAALRRRAPKLVACPECGTQVEDPAECSACIAEEEARRVPFRFCAGCGNEVPSNGDCPICAAAEARREKAPAEDDEDRSYLCTGCGNEVYGSGPCGVCSLGRGGRKEKRKARLTLCPGCGHEVEDVRHCPICRQGKSLKQAKHLDALCPKCDDALEAQDWDGADVMVCPTCTGCLFKGRALEVTLDKLRENIEGQTVRNVLAEFKDRHKRGRLPEKFQYKSCPVCRLAMVRRNYAGVSGVVVDVCGQHGTWVDQHAFADLTDFVTRGGDTLAKLRERPKRR